MTSPSPTLPSSSLALHLSHTISLFDPQLLLPRSHCRSRRLHLPCQSRRHEGPWTTTHASAVSGTSAFASHSTIYTDRVITGNVKGSPHHLPQVPNARPMCPPAFPSKFYEHFLSVSSMGHTSTSLLTPRSTNGSGSSSGPSIRSTCPSNAPQVSTSDSCGQSSRHSIYTRPEMLPSSSS
ncbi:hypothetical protein DFH29DRAFT_1005219 [Suillus ampliporus]|nr:hypothetical protein DFH29DRAFT_1005219 [Suillus ampliporus]